MKSEADCPDCGSKDIRKGEDIKWECNSCKFWWNVYEHDEDFPQTISELAEPNSSG